MKKMYEMDVVFLLDRSGSMYGFEDDTIGGYNKYLDEQRENKVKSKITTILFDNTYTELTYREDIDEVSNLTRKEYVIGGSTALLDAIGKTITKIEHDSNGKVLFIITTDGLENASIEFNKKQIRKMIGMHDNWEFIYLGANIDSFKEGNDLGISSQNIANYIQNKAGIKKMYKSLSKASTCLYECDSLANWKDDLEN